MYEYVLLILSFIFGAIIGSFLNVVILRMPKEETLLGRSHCPKCKRELSATDLIPVFSYIALLGKCRKCKSKISSRYIIIELVAGFLFASAFYYFKPTVLIDIIELIRAWFFISVIISVFVIDLEHYLILDRIVFPSSIVILTFNVILDIVSGKSVFALSSMTLLGLGSAVFSSGIFLLIWTISRGKWIGFGDVKLMLFLGQALVLPLGFVGFFLSFFIGTFTAIPLLLSKRFSLASKLPLGTFLSIGYLVAYFYGKDILNWYLVLIGIR